MKIKLLVMDVDGTLTDGRIYIGVSGEVMKAFDIRDGYAIAHMLPEMGVIPVIITGRKSEIVSRRAEELHIEEIHQGILDKLPKLREIAEKYGVTLKETAYIGDDLYDLPCIRACGYSGCPKDAVDEIVEAVDYVCEHESGRGAVREFISHIKKHHV